jgi:murein DD-endopeptidase MepM/ murein hydrolase activator NlpD
MRLEGKRARSHAHSKRYGRNIVHAVVVVLAASSVIFATRYSLATGKPAAVNSVPAFAFSGVAGVLHGRDASFLHPGPSLQTLPSVPIPVSRVDTMAVRTTAGVNPISSFSTGVTAATASNGENGSGVVPLADIIDPLKPFVLYTTQVGDSVSGIAGKYGISVQTLLNNNPTVSDRNLIQKGQEIVIPRKEGILYKVGHGDTVDKIVAQFDNITTATVLEYRPNAITDPKSLETGRYVLLPGATVKPPPPPPPEPKLAPRPTGASGPPPPNSGGRFSYPLNNWLRVSDPFGTNRGGGTYHTGIDLDLFGRHHSPIYSACNGVVARTEYLTYSYGYHVIVDCGDGWTTLYAHMDAIMVTPGQKVTQGTQLGISGLTGFTTGEHLHFEIRLNGAYLNPAAYLAF